MIPTAPRCRPRRARRLMGVALAGAVAVLAACGDDGGDDTTSPERFQEEAVAACSSFYGELIVEILEAIDPATGEPDPELEQAATQRVVALADDLTSDLRGIGAPEGQEDAWTEWVDLLDESLDELREDPTVTLGERDPDPERSDRIAELSDELGVPVCSGDEVPEVDDDVRVRFAEVVAASVQAELAVIDDDETACIATELADRFTFTELLELEDLGAAPTDQQAELTDLITTCLRAETLLELGR